MYIHNVYRVLWLLKGESSGMAPSSHVCIGTMKLLPSSTVYLGDEYKILLSIYALQNLVIV